MLQEDYLIFLDVETSGFNYLRNDIISMCMIKTDLKLNIIDDFYQTVKCPINEYYSDDAELIHGFKKHQISTFQEPEQFIKKILDFLGDFRYKLITHTNTNFDYNFILGMFLKNGSQFDLYQRIIKIDSTIKLGKKAGYKINNLKSWSETLGFDLNHHSALSDTRCCYEIYKYLKGEYKL